MNALWCVCFLLSLDWKQDCLLYLVVPDEGALSRVYWREP